MYSGTFKEVDGERLVSGAGLFKLKNGSVWKGQFKDGKRDGFITEYAKNGDILESERKDDLEHGFNLFRG